ncbi:MAG: hypothetical protein NTV94_04610 [Planctomycetota bacterium]|nr:hypothetical protein [Planctomycetota bacterium]
MTGLGDQLERAATIESEVLLIIPPFGCPTRPVYHAFDRLLGGNVQHASFERVRGLMNEPTPLCERALFNDLTRAAAAVAPDLEPLRSRIASMIDRPVHVTGSGSCMFALPSAAADPALRSSWVRSVEAAGACAVWTRFAAREA